MLTCSQRNIAARSALVEEHPERHSIRHSIVNVARSLPLRSQGAQKPATAARLRAGLRTAG
jgi:hypothetical protein